MLSPNPSTLVHADASTFLLATTCNSFIRQEQPTEHMLALQHPSYRGNKHEEEHHLHCTNLPIFFSTTNTNKNRDWCDSYLWFQIVQFLKTFGEHPGCFSGIINKQEIKSNYKRRKGRNQQEQNEKLKQNYRKRSEIETRDYRTD